MSRRLESGSVVLLVDDAGRVTFRHAWAEEQRAGGFGCEATADFVFDVGDVEDLKIALRASGLIDDIIAPWARFVVGGATVVFKEADALSFLGDTGAGPIGLPPLPPSGPSSTEVVEARPDEVEAEKKPKTTRTARRRKR